MSRKRTKKGNSRGVTPQFYRGRTTVNIDSAEKIRKQKEYRRKKHSQQKRIQLTQHVIRWAKLVAAIVIFVVILGQLRISSVQFSSDANTLDPTDASTLTDYADEYLGKGLNRFKPFFNSDDFSNTIVNKASFVADIEVNAGLFGSTVNAKVTQKNPLYRLGTNQMPANNQALWVTNDGSVLSLTSEQTIKQLESGLASTVTIADKSGVEYESGDSILSVNQVEYILLAEEYLSEQQLSLASVELDEGIRDIRLYIMDKPFYILVTFDRPVDVLSVDLPQILNSVKRRGVAITQYIDLRIVDKAFYK